MKRVLFLEKPEKYRLKEDGTSSEYDAMQHWFGKFGCRSKLVLSLAEADFEISKGDVGVLLVHYGDENPADLRKKYPHVKYLACSGPVKESDCREKTHFVQFLLEKYEEVVWGHMDAAARIAIILKEQEKAGVQSCP